MFPILLALGTYPPNQWARNLVTHTLYIRLSMTKSDIRTLNFLADHTI